MHDKEKKRLRALIGRAHDSIPPSVDLAIMTPAQASYLLGALDGVRALLSRALFVLGGVGSIGSEGEAERG